MRYDYVIVGSGIAGLYAALQAREHGTVLVLRPHPDPSTSLRVTPLPRRGRGDGGEGA